MKTCRFALQMPIASGTHFLKSCVTGIRALNSTRLGRPGNDLLSRVLRRSTIGAGAFHGRVRNGIGCSHPAIITRSAETCSFWLTVLIRSRATGQPPHGRRNRRVALLPGLRPSSRSLSMLSQEEFCFWTFLFDQHIGKPMLVVSQSQRLTRSGRKRSEWALLNESNQAYRAISTGKLHALPHFHTQPINVVVFHGSQGELVSRWVSCLDAFSSYPFRT